MRFKQYPNKNKPVFLYIHGECLSAFSFKEEVKELKKDFTVILPVLDGHGEDHLTSFTSIDNISHALISYLDEHYHGHIQVLSGFSLGGQIAVHMLSKRPDLCDYAIIESAMMTPVKLRNWCAYASVHTNSLAKQKWFNQFMYYTIFNDDFAFTDYHQNYKTMKKENIQAILDATYGYHMDQGIQHTTCKMAILVGQREKKILKKSANLLHEQVENAKLFMLMNDTHGNLSLGNPREYIRFVKSWIQHKNMQQRKAMKKRKAQQEGEFLPNWKHIINKLKASKQAATNN